MYCAQGPVLLNFLLDFRKQKAANVKPNPICREFVKSVRKSDKSVGKSDKSVGKSDKSARKSDRSLRKSDKYVVKSQICFIV